MAQVDARLFGFLPWLRLERAVTVGAFEFEPYTIGGLASSSHPEQYLGPVIDSILRSYFDPFGEPITGCTIIAKGGSHLITSDERKSAGDDVLTLMLGAVSLNRYHTPWQQLTPYANSGMFRLYAHHPMDFSDGISLPVRRRTGLILSHISNPHFQCPQECHILKPLDVDSALIAALKQAATSAPTIVRQVRNAMRLFAMASSDAEFMSEDAEIVFLVGAFETLINVSGDKGKFARELSRIFDDAVLHDGAPVEIQNRKTRAVRIAEHELDWPDRQHWAKALYGRRNEYVHGKEPEQAPWTDPELAQFAAFLFPLTVKVLLRDLGIYQLSNLDTDNCATIDAILREADWTARDEHQESAWSRVVSEVKSERRQRRALARYDLDHNDQT